MSTNGIRAVKGMRDLLPPETALWNHVESLAREVFRTYGYGEIRTPLVEETQLFARGVGVETDIVAKEMYTFEDRDGGSLTLRPEATASVVRAYIEHGLNRNPGLTKLYYIGPMFRRERPQKGRYRQFFQIGAEAIGSESPAVDAEIIEMLWEFLKRTELQPMPQVILNSLGDAACRPNFLAALKESLANVKDRMCSDCRRRADTNPLRVLDCKVTSDQEIIESLPKITEFLCDPCREHYARVQDYLKERGIPFTPTPRMVRGLDYYTRTTFEFVHESLGAQNSVLGGGRYDGLAETIGGQRSLSIASLLASQSTPGVGFSIGEDRLINLLAESEGVPAERPDVYAAWIEFECFSHTARLATELRRAGLAVVLPPERRKIGRLMEQASKLGARYALIVGTNEMASGRYQLKNLETGEQRELTRDEILAALRPASAAAVLNL
jgi:histidyl-tRNA synthetase